MKKKGYQAPVWFNEEEIPDESKRQAMNDGLNVMTRSILDLVEFCIARRLKQYLEVMEEAMKKKD